MKKWLVLISVIVLLTALSACAAPDLPTYVVADNGEFKMLGNVKSVVAGRKYSSEFGCKQYPDGEYNLITGLVFLTPFWDKNTKVPFLTGFEYPAAKSVGFICPSHAVFHLPLGWGTWDAIEWLGKHFPDYSWYEDPKGFRGGIHLSYAK